MIPSFLYWAFCRVLQLIRLIGRSDTDLAIEVVMLRHEVAVLRRQIMTGAAACRLGGPRRLGATRSPSASRKPLRSTGNHAALAPEPRRQALDLPARSTRSTGDPQGNCRAHPPAGQREPELGLPPHPRRACYPRHRHRPFERLGDLAASRRRAVAAAIGTDLGGVPLRTGEGIDGRRLLPCRHGAPPQALRPRVLQEGQEKRSSDWLIAQSRLRDIAHSQLLRGKSAGG